jgi:hypothetical protein
MTRILLSLLASSVAASAQYRAAPFAIGGEHQFSTDVDDGSSFSRSTARLRAGAPLFQNSSTSIGLTTGYVFEDYDFDDAAVEPWSELHRARLGLVATSEVGDRWSYLIAPYASANFESGADFGESLTYGGLAAAWYRFNDNFSFGLGAGVASELEDDVFAFPLVVLSWNINDCVTLSTFPSEGFRYRPGINLSWDVREDLTLGFVYQYQSDQHRLNEDSLAAADGVGEFRQHRLSLAATYRFTDNLGLTAHAGVGLAGELEVQDADGDTVAEEDFDPSLILGVEAAYRF